MRTDEDCRLTLSEEGMTWWARQVHNSIEVTIPWEELDELSRRENAITGRDVDYQQTDIDNVLTMPKLLRAGEKKGAEK